MRRRRDLARTTLIGGGSFWNKKSRKQAQEAYYYSQDPGPFFQYVRRLLDTHQLVAESAYIAGKAAAFRILYQNDKA